MLQNPLIKFHTLVDVRVWQINDVKKSVVQVISIKIDRKFIKGKHEENS